MWDFLATSFSIQNKGQIQPLVHIELLSLKIRYYTLLDSLQIQNKWEESRFQINVKIDNVDQLVALQHYAN